MTPPPHSSALRPVCHLALAGSALILAACADAVNGPDDSRGSDLRGGSQSPASAAASNNGHAKNDAAIDGRVIIDEATGRVLVDVTTGQFNAPGGEVPPVPGSSVEKLTVDLQQGVDCQSDYKFNKVAPNGGKVRVELPEGSCAREGEPARLTVHVKGLKNGKGSDVVVIHTVVLSGDFSGVPGGEPVPFDVSVLPMQQVTADNPVFDIAVEASQAVGTTIRYDVTVSNAGSGITAQVRCEVRVDGIDVTSDAQFWIDGAGNPTSALGETIALPSGTARICRFAVSFTEARAYSISVTAVATGATEADADNNSTAAVVTATGVPPLSNFSWNLRQDESLAGDGTSLGITSQSASIQMEWKETLATDAGIDTWSFTLRSSTNGGVFDERVGSSVALARFTQAEVGTGQVCRNLQPEAASVTRPYLRSSVRICATYNAATAPLVTMRVEYVVFYPQAGTLLPATDAWLWGPTFSLFASIEHHGVGTFGDTEETRTLNATTSGGTRILRYLGS